jgi:Na+-translocating ferredoxin:NAD+ oxidoreductase RnfD subunit
MTYLVGSVFVASLVVRYWPGQPPARRVSSWIDWLWLLIGVVFVAGLVLAFFNVATTPLPGGGFLHRWSIPSEVGYAFAAISVPLAMLTILGAGQIARAEARAFSPDAVRAWATGGRLRRIGIRLAVALAAAGVLSLVGGSTLRSDSTYSDALSFAVGLTATIALLAALVSAWRAARTPSEGP